MGQRFVLSSLLLKAGRFSDALSFCQVWLDPQYDGLNRPRGGCEFNPPNPELLTARLVEWHSKPWSPGKLLLNAAYAAFGLWGDCELARQYLVLGTRANPNIFVKVLARREKPGKSFLSASTGSVRTYFCSRRTLLATSHDQRHRRGTRLPLADAGPVGRA